jgi:transposase-like protein
MGKRKNNTYSQEFKEKAVQRYLNGEDSYRGLCAKLGIRDTKQLRNWVAKTQRGESLDDMRGLHTGTGKKDPRTKFDSIEEELAYVKAERDYLKKLYRSRFGKEWGADD